MSSNSMENLEIPKLLSVIKDPEKKVAMRKDMANKFGKLPSDRLKPALAGILSILNELYERRGKSEDLQVLGELLLSLGQLSFTFPDEEQIKGVLQRILKKINPKEKEMMYYALNALKRSVASHPEMILEFREKITHILTTKGEEDLKKLALNVIARASWIMPYLVGEFKSELMNLIKEGTPKVREFTLLSIYRIGRKNYYVLESIIKELLPEEGEAIEEETLFLLCNLNIPPDQKEVIEKLFKLEEDVLMESKDPKSRIRAVKGLAHLVKKKELPDLQEKFARRLRLKIEEAMNDEEKKELLSSISIPDWADMHIVEPLISLSVDIITSAMEEKEIKLKAAEVLNANLQLFHEYSTMVVNAYLEVLDTGWGEDIKSKIITLLTSIPILNQKENEKMIDSLLTFIGKREEGILPRIDAVEALSKLTSRIPRIIEKFGEKIYEIYHAVTITDVKKTIVEISGELIEKLEISGRSPFLSVLIEALTNRHLYPQSMEYLATIAWRDPTPLIHYTEDLFKFPENIKKIEGQRKEIGSIERISSFERPKRLYIRLLSNLIELKPEITENTVNIFLNFLKDESRENLIREVAYGLKDAYEVKPEVVEGALSQAELSEEVLRRIKALR